MSGAIVAVACVVPIFLSNCVRGIGVIVHPDERCLELVCGACRRAAAPVSPRLASTSSASVRVTAWSGTAPRVAVARDDARGTRVRRPRARWSRDRRAARLRCDRAGDAAKIQVRTVDPLYRHAEGRHDVRHRSRPPQVRQEDGRHALCCRAATGCCRRAARQRHRHHAQYPRAARRPCIPPRWRETPPE